MHLITYFKESWQELTKVNWPTRAQTVRFTVAVIVFSVVLAMFMGTVDIGLNALVKRLILKQ